VRLFTEHGVTPLWRYHRIAEQEQLLALVAAGSGAVLIHSHRAGITGPEVVVLPLQEEVPPHRLHLVWRRGETSAAILAAVEVARTMPRGTAALHG